MGARREEWAGPGAGGTATTGRVVTIRRETPDDAAAIAATHVRAWQTGYAGIIPDETLNLLNPAAWAQRRRDLGTAAADHPFTTLVVEDGPAVAGFVTFGPYRIDQDRDRLDPAYAEILGLYVEPSRWGNGTGRALFAAARAALAERGWTELRLWVLEDNRRARAFYERAGMVADGERSRYEIKRSGGRSPLGLAEIRYTGRLG
ncbi:GNAT family N-acetyltransferase [Plantactinospora sp. GCM10030261]|uniref:GNAT family N-acetyltransferase n=1 Tax=Plantactinospora sp. GCM10030261 TaxID=3273420 RepID=UPI00360A3A93